MTVSSKFKVGMFLFGVSWPHVTRRCGIAEQHAFHPADELSPAPDKGKGGREPTKIEKRDYHWATIKGYPFIM